MGKVVSIVTSRAYIMREKNNHKYCLSQLTCVALGDSANAMDQEKEMKKSTMNELQGNTSNLLQIPAMAKRRSSSTSDVEEFSSKVNHPKLRSRPSSDTDLSAVGKECVAEPSRGRFQTSFSSTEYFSHYDSASKLTEQAKHLSQEEMESLVLDIFKPLDFYEILFNRMKIGDSEAKGEQAEGQSEGQSSSE